MNLVEDYCSYEVSKMLKEKGFDIPCRAYYNMGALKEDITFPNDWNNSSFLDHISAPTHQMAMAWLREVHNLFFQVGFGNDNKGEFLYMVDIFDLKNNYIDGRYEPIVEADDYLTYNPKTYEEAVEAALKYSLENLI